MKLGMVAVVLLVVASSASGQGVLRGWGGQVFDSSWNDEHFVEVAGGDGFTLARRADGSVVGWGKNQYGVCNIPALPAGVSYAKVSGGNQHAMALRSDGSVVAWGSPTFGVLNVPPLPPGLTYVDVAAGAEHSVARRSDGSVVAWGWPSWCQVPSLPTGLTCVSISASIGDEWPCGHTVAILSDGSLACWGSNLYGQCVGPVLGAGFTYVQAAAGSIHTVALVSDGSVVAWGDNSYGQCNVPALPPGLTCVEVAAAGSHSLARMSDGTVVAWGDNFWGECNVPLLPSGLTYVAIATGAYHSLARVSDGRVVAWSANAVSECNVPRPPPGLRYVQLSVAEHYSLARVSDGTVVAWGDNSLGNCTVPPLPSGLTYVDVVAGWQPAAIRSDGALVLWGGVWPPAWPPGPALVTVYTAPAGLTYTQDDNGNASPYYNHVAAVRSDGALVAWGNGGFSGQCLPCGIPPLPPGLSYVEVATNGGFDVARRSDGSVVTWGTDGFSYTGTAPAPPPGLTCVEIAVGSYHAVARLANGNVVGWGYNAQGQCNAPALPAGMTYDRIAASGNDTVALRSDGALVSFAGMSFPPAPPGMRCFQIDGRDGRIGALYEYVAAVTSVGSGCGGVGTPLLSCTAPTIGQTLTIGLTNGTPGAWGGLYVSGVPGAPIQLGSGCTLAVDAASAVPFAFFTADLAGVWSMSTTIPLDQALAGLRAALQAALFATQGPLGLDLSNGLDVTVGF